MKTAFIFNNTIYNTIFSEDSLIQMQNFGLSEELIARIIERNKDEAITSEDSEEFILEDKFYCYVCLIKDNLIHVEKIILSSNVL